MIKRDKWLCIRCVTYGIALVLVAFLVCDVIMTMFDINRMSKRRSMLLYKTDHQLLLDACREISKKMTEGKIKDGSYSIHSLIVKHDLQTRQFPQTILKLDPLNLYVSKDGKVRIIMWPALMYGVDAFPEDYKGSISEVIPEWSIKLLDGLWYFDEDFIQHPEHKKEVEELLEERKAKDLKDNASEKTP